MNFEHARRLAEASAGCCDATTPKATMKTANEDKFIMVAGKFIQNTPTGQ
jgi:hypothetical protein